MQLFSNHVQWAQQDGSFSYHVRLKEEIELKGKTISVTGCEGP
jgi:hypothetical protein